MGVIYQYLSDDHRRLDKLLKSAIREDGSVNHEDYGAFRQGILRHIAIEEKVLTVRLQKKNKLSGYEERLRLDHGAITALLVPVPDEQILKSIAHILEGHNIIEEKEGGFYAWCDKVLIDEIDEVEKEMKQMPFPKLLPNLPLNQVRESLLRVLKKAGYGNLLV